MHHIFDWTALRSDNPASFFSAPQGKRPVRLPWHSRFPSIELSAIKGRTCLHRAQLAPFCSNSYIQIRLPGCGDMCLSPSDIFAYLSSVFLYLIYTLPYLFIQPLLRLPRTGLYVSSLRSSVISLVQISFPRTTSKSYSSCFMWKLFIQCMLCNTSHMLFQNIFSQMFSVFRRS